MIESFSCSTRFSLVRDHMYTRTAVVLHASLLFGFALFVSLGLAL